MYVQYHVRGALTVHMWMPASDQSTKHKAQSTKRKNNRAENTEAKPMYPAERQRAD